MNYAHVTVEVDTTTEWQKAMPDLMKRIERMKIAAPVKLHLIDNRTGKELAAPTKDT